MIGKTIYHYIITEKLGSGGMGEVYIAEDKNLNRKVALKFLPTHLTKDKESKERFKLEAQSAAALNHPNIITIYEINEYEEQIYIAMEYVEGETLRSKIGSKSLEIRESIEIIKQICNGLAKAHTAGIIHRDIKPENIIIDNENRVKILDFGLAKLKGKSNITKDISTIGTVMYMSPEQVSGKYCDQRTDIWSLGIVLCEMLTGKPPFDGSYEQAIIYSILNDEPAIGEKDFLPLSLRNLIGRMLQKDPEERISSIEEFEIELENIFNDISDREFQKSVKRSRFLQLKIIFPATIIITAIVLFFVLKIIRMNKIIWTKEVALPEIEELIISGGTGVNNIEAYKIAMEADKYIPEDSTLKEFIRQVTGVITIKTKPSGAKIYRKPFDKNEMEWEYIGLSPIDTVTMPKYLYNWKFEKSGYELLYRQFWSRGPMDWSTGKYTKGFQEVILEKVGSSPKDMIRIPGTQDLPDYYIDKYEITNKQYKEFIDGGGYQDEKYWKHPIYKGDKVISREEALSEFRDMTKRLGPAPWEGGIYKEGEENFPVNGISWYEAAAYAEFAGKSLPTVYHWEAAARGSLGMLSHLFYSMSNFNGRGPVSIGTTSAMSQFGVYDMAGNVREWCWNESDIGRCIRGGAWNDVHYMYSSLTQADPFDRSIKNGIRCVIYPDTEEVPESLFAVQQTISPRNFYAENPVSDDIFKVYKEMFSYDKLKLEPVIEASGEKSEYYIHQKISFNAAYNNERMLIHLFLPKNIKTPYQTVLYFPGSGSVFVPSSENIEEYYEFKWNLSYYLMNGRAVVYPIYKGTFERQDGIPGSLHYLYDDSHLYRDYIVKIVKDVRRVIDYLETRAEIDPEKIAFCGFSWGGIQGSILPAVEKRIKISIINAGGLEMYTSHPKEEADYVNYVSRVTIPTLMLHGRFDANVSYYKAAKPMFDLLGTPEKDKKLIVYETDHIIPHKELIKESLNWLDMYFGKVDR